LIGYIIVRVNVILYKLLGVYIIEIIVATLV